MLNLIKSAILGEFVPLEDRIQREIKEWSYEGELSDEDVKDIKNFEKFIQFSIGTTEVGSPILLTGLIEKISEYMMNNPNYRLYAEDTPYLVLTYSILVVDGLCRIATGNGIVAEIKSLVRKI